MCQNCVDETKPFVPGEPVIIKKEDNDERSTAR